MSLGSSTHPLGTLIHREFLTNVKAQVDTLFVSNGTDAVSIAMRRDGSTLASQTVRLVMPGAGGEVDDRAASVSTGRVLVQGSADLDIEVGDRFNHDGALFEVTYIRPNRQHETLADAQVVRT